MTGTAHEAAIEVEGVSFTAGKTEILRDVAFAAAAYQTTAILGPSGCGKTTLLRVIAGLERPDTGRVLFEAEDVTDIPSYRRGFGMMFQDFALFPHLTVDGNVGFGLRHSHLPRPTRGERVRALLELVGLSGYGSRTTESLSGGERQRVALARALAPAPRLLMLDEPLGSLDRTLRERLLVELRGILSRLGVSTIYVTHDQLEAFAIADRVAIMRAGRIVREGTPREIYEEPATVFVARFLGMENIVSGECDGLGTVTTAVGRWPGVDGPAGTVDVLLRSNRAAVAEGPGTGVVSGTLSSRLFQGALTRVRVATVAGELEFELPGETPLPPEGGDIYLRVPRVQALARDG